MANLKEFPTQIQELLKKRGWAWPPTEEMKKEWEEVAEKAAGSIHGEPEINRETWLQLRGHYWGEEK